MIYLRTPNKIRD